MKAIDELIEKYFDKDESLLSDEMCDEILKDLEQLKAELKEQHKKDVINAWTSGKESVINFEIKTCTSSAEQYYNENQ
jgi:NAD-dependent DNA ligase